MRGDGRGDGRNRTGYGSACRARRYLSCHPRGRLRHHLPRPAVFMVFTLWTCQLSSLYERLSGRELSGTVNSAELNENRPGGAFPGAAAGKCLLALTRQPLRRRGQPKAATPDSCIRAASAPGERSCIHGKTMTGNRAIVFSCAFRDVVPVPGDGPAGISAGAWLSVWLDSWCGVPPVRPAPGWVPASDVALLPVRRRHLAGRVRCRKAVTGNSGHTGIISTTVRVRADQLERRGWAWTATGEL